MPGTSDPLHPVQHQEPVGPAAFITQRDASSERPQERPTLINHTWLDVDNYHSESKNRGYEGEALDRLVVRWRALLKRAKSEQLVRPIFD